MTRLLVLCWLVSIFFLQVQPALSEEWFETSEKAGIYLDLDSVKKFDTIYQYRIFSGNRTSIIQSASAGELIKIRFQFENSPGWENWKLFKPDSAIGVTHQSAELVHIFGKEEFKSSSQDVDERNQMWGE